MILLDGKKISNEIAEALKARIGVSGIAPTLAIIQIGELEESNLYIKHKKSFADKIGANVLHVHVTKDVSQDELLEKIESLNKDLNVNGIIVQLPIPSHLNKRELIDRIDPQKDVDGLHSVNQAKIFQGDVTGIVPATPKGIMTLLRKHSIELEGKKALVIGRSLLVGRPVAMLLLSANATVAIAHSKTKNLDALVQENEVIIVATGTPAIIKAGMVNERHCIVDVGTNSISGTKTLEEIDTVRIVGDVEFDEVSKVVSAISPVPGGVGPMTVASLFENLVQVSGILEH